MNKEKRMRIGAFAKENNVSIDTVRHYIDLGLVLPEKEKGGQYSFDDHCQEQIREVISLKDMGFRLKEIKNLFLYKLLGHMTGYQKDEYYRMIFADKYRLLTEEIDGLTSARKRLAEELEVLEIHKEKRHHTLGVPLSALNILACPRCGGALTISEGDIKEDAIIHGILKCSCGNHYIIDDGVLMIDDSIGDYEFEFEGTYVSQYINATDNDYLANIYKRINWIQRIIDFESLDGKTVLDLGSGVGFAIRNLYHLLPEGCHYIAVDHDLKRHRFLKRILEKAIDKKKIIFVCADFSRIPLTEQSVDWLLDFSGTSNYSFDHSDFLLDKVSKYLKDKGHLIGTFILFKKFVEKSIVEAGFRSNFQLSHIQKKLADLGYVKISEYESETLSKGGDYENYFLEGERVASYQFYGQRLG